MHLVGDRAVIVEASVPTDSLCLIPGGFDGVSGVCIHGEPVIADGQLVGITPISNVSVEGVTVRDFSGPGIVALGVDGLRIADVVAARNGEMGMFINMVSRLSLQDSWSYGNHGDGVFLENLPEGATSDNAVVAGNHLFGNLGSGVMFLNSLGGRIAGNDLHGNCAGIVVFAENEAYGAATSGDVSIQRNRVTANNRWCPADLSGAPDYGGVGIALLGAQNTTVERNLVKDNREQAGSLIHGGGIVLVTLAETSVSGGSTSPTGNSVRRNQLSRNTPFDLFSDGSGSANTLSDNSCRTTNVGGC